MELTTLVAVVAMVQDSVVTVPEPVQEMGATISMLIVALLGLVESVILTGLRFGSDAINKIPKPLKAVILAAVSVPVAWLAGVAGLDLPADPTAWDGTVVNAILMWLSAMGVNAFGNAVASKEPPAQ